MSKKITVTLLAALLLANGGLLWANTAEAKARFDPTRTCSVHVGTDECHCHLTIIQECDPNEDPIPQCKVQCALE